MRLIDADAWVKEFDEVITKIEESNNKEPISKEDFIKLLKIIRGGVEEQPTAYNVDAVVKELEDIKNAPKRDCPYNTGWKSSVECAIEIVIKGGVE